MDAALQAALAGEPEQRPFHGATVAIRHMSANQRLALGDEFSGESGKIDGQKAVDFYKRLIATYVVGVTAEDAEALADASFPRVEELALLVMDVNGIGGEKERAKN